MKKIFYFIASAIVALGAVACQNEGLDNIAPEANGDIVSFVANIDNTKTDLSGMNTVWTAGDAIMVTWNNNTYEFKNSEADVNTFTCQAEGLSAIVDAEEITATYSENNDGMIDSTAGLEGALLSFEGSFAELENVGFQVQNAFLKFTTTGAAVKLKGDKLFVVDGEVVNGIVIEEAGDHYVAINPATATITYDIDGMDVKTSQENTFEARKIYDLGTLEVVASGYNVVGSFQGWDVSAAGAVKMYQYKDWAIAQGVELYKSDEFKIVKGNSWDVSYGFEEVAVMNVNEEVVLEGVQNIKAAKNGKFDIYFNGETKTAKYVCVEEYTGTVNIKFNNAANWNPVYITLKSGNTTIVDKALVSNNTYAVSMDYIGESLSYTVTTSDANKKVEGAITLAKDGATINIVEQVIRITFQLNTANAKQWWGNNSYIYIWNTDPSVNSSSFNSAAQMTSDGNYTWHYDLPASLAGKKLTYIIHNGNGWQSRDSTITTLSLDGHTVTGSSIGIN